MLYHYIKLGSLILSSPPEIHVLAPFGSHTLYVHQAVRLQVTELGSVKGEGKAYQQASFIELGSNNYIP